MLVYCSVVYIISIHISFVEKPSYTPILNWETVVHKIPWGIIILLGGGFALADASKVSLILLNSL
jgi:sodium-dependent dicarboxylate transporter 2/3/5